MPSNANSQSSAARSNRANEKPPEYSAVKNRSRATRAYATAFFAIRSALGTLTSQARPTFSIALMIR